MGEELWFREAAGKRGTVVELSRLFFNTPARREFLKSAVSEGRAIKREVLEKMLAWPDRAFEYYADGKKVFSSSAGSLLERIADLYKQSLADELLEVSYEKDGMNLSGYAAPFHKDSSSRKDQFFILNGRPVASASLSHALRSAYGNLMPAGRQPIAFLNLAVDPAEVNVNIHPAKREVRFRREQDVYSLIRRGVEEAITSRSDYAPLQFSRSFAAKTVFDHSERSLDTGLSVASEKTAKVEKTLPLNFSNENINRSRTFSVQEQTGFPHNVEKPQIEIGRGQLSGRFFGYGYSDMPVF